MPSDTLISFTWFVQIRSMKLYQKHHLCSQSKRMQEGGILCWCGYKICIVLEHWLSRAGKGYSNHCQVSLLVSTWFYQINIKKKTVLLNDRCSSTNLTQNGLLPVSMLLKCDASATRKSNSPIFWGHPQYIITGRNDSSDSWTLVAFFCLGSHFAICPWTYELEYCVGDKVKASDPKVEAVYGGVIEEERLNEGCLSSGEQLQGMRCLFIMVLDEELAWLSVNDMKPQIASLETSSKHHNCVITPAGEKAISVKTIFSLIGSQNYSMDKSHSSEGYSCRTGSFHFSDVLKEGQ